jgi:histidine triad (HIT) family protein
MADDPDCIFCSIVAGDAPATIVDEDEHTVAFMDIHPWTPGHALVIPREHHKNLYEIDEETLCQVMTAAKRLSLKVRDALNADGVNLLNSTERAAWQTVFHFHVHVIPRYEDDPLELPVRPEEGDPDEIKEIAEKLRG